MNKVLGAIVGLLWLGACAGTHEERAQQATLARGYEIAEANCSACHAVGRTGRGAAPEAPPFRTLSRRYRVDTLEEALGEGISVGHPAMPEFQFEPNDVHALISYLQSIQDTNAAHPDPH